MITDAPNLAVERTRFARRSPRRSPQNRAADAHYRQALALVAQLGMRPLVARCCLALGRLSRRTGQRTEAQQYLATATAMYREMDMRFFLEQAEAELKELA